MNRNPDVDKYLDQKQHPLTNEIQRVRELMLEADPRVEEVIKWSSPTFMYKGNIASFFMNSKKHVSLMFHKGALLPNRSGLLEGDGKEARTAKFSDLDDIEKKAAAVKATVQEWIEFQDNN